MFLIIFYTILVIIIFEFVLERFLDYLNSTKWTNVLPKELVEIYDNEKYALSQNYEKEKHNFSLLTSSFSFVLIILMLLFDGFAFVDTLVRNYFENETLISIIFFGLIMFASDILSTPFSIYSTFKIEEKYGFNKTTAKTFILDKLKSWLLSIVLGGGILWAIITIYNYTTDNFWIISWAFISFFMIFFTMFYSTLIVPLFNKQKPLEDGELKNAINEFCTKVGFKLKNVFVIDGSKRSTKANAYFTGLGSKKRIVLYDTLINDLSTEEIVAVLAHEVGHYKKKHIFTSIIISLFQTGVTFYILGLLIGNIELSKALGVSYNSFHISLIAFGILYSPISMIVGIFMNIFSRYNEYQADEYAAINYYKEHLISGLKKLSIKNLSNLTPHPLYVFFHYSHPTLLQRIKALNKF